MSTIHEPGHLDPLPYSTDGETIFDVIGSAVATGIGCSQTAEFIVAACNEHKRQRNRIKVLEAEVNAIREARR